MGGTECESIRRVPSEHLNFFEPWPHLAGHHENQLTRAFLVVLKMSPVAHQAWLRLVDPNLDLSRLPQASLDTQTAAITRSDQPGADGEQPIRGLSVLQAADIEQLSGPVGESERAAIFDGVVAYGDKLVLVVEVKFWAPPSDHQARQIPVGDRLVLLDPRGRPVDWRELLESWQGLVYEGHVSGAEMIVISDFLEFVDRNHSQLGPNRRLHLCGRDEARILSRLRTVLEQAENQVAWVAERDGWAAVEARGETAGYLFLAVRDLDKPSPRVMIVLYPADTLYQARKLYGDRPDRVPAVLALRDANWELYSCFHMGYIQRGIAWDEWGACDVEDYVGYWVDHIGDARRMSRAEWMPRFKEMASAGVISSGYPETFNELDDYMDPLSPRPGMELSFSWPLDEAARLDDDQDRFVAAVSDKIREALAALGDR